MGVMGTRNRGNGGNGGKRQGQGLVDGGDLGYWVDHGQGIGVMGARSKGQG